MKLLDQDAIGELLPNLDASVSVEEMEEYMKDLQELHRVTEWYADYAESKASAMRCRLSGNIPSALAYEKAADTFYDRLPKWARW